MNKGEAMELAQRKANDWRSAYRVMRVLDHGTVDHRYEVWRGDSEDSPPGYRLVEIFRPVVCDETP